MKERLEDFLNSKHSSLIVSTFMVILVLIGISNGFFESLLGVDNSYKSQPVVETVTYREEGNIHPIFLSTKKKLPEDSKGLGFVLKDLDSGASTYSEYAEDSIVVSFKRGFDDSTYRYFAPRLDRKYLFLYNTETNTYKSYPVASFEKHSNKEGLIQQLKEKYGYAYDYLHVKYEPNNSITISYLEDGSAIIVYNEDVKVANQDEVDKAYEKAPKPE